MRTSVVLAVIAVIAIIEVVSTATTSSSDAVEKRGIWDRVKQFGLRARGYLGRAKNATKGFLGDLRKKVGGVFNKISRGKFSKISAAVKSIGFKAAQVTGVGKLVKMVRKRLGNDVDNLSDKELKQIVMAVNDKTDVKVPKKADSDPVDDVSDVVVDAPSNFYNATTDVDDTPADVDAPADVDDTPADVDAPADVDDN